MAPLGFADWYLLGAALPVGSFVGDFRVTGNAGAGVRLSNGSTATFGGGNVTSNGGQGDVVCNPNYTTVNGSPATVGAIVGCP